MSEAPAQVAPPPRIAGSAWLSIALISLAMVVLFWDFLLNQARYSLRPDWSHSYVIPLISLYYIFLNRESILRHPVRRNWLGIPLFLAGIVVYWFFTLGPTWNHTAQGAGFVWCVLGIVLFLTGWRMWTSLLFPMLYLSLGVTVSSRLLGIVTPTLQVWAAKGSYVLLNIFGYDTEISGTVLELSHKGQVIPLNIAEACAGMRMIVAFVALGIAMAAISCDRWWQRIILALLAVPIAILVNVVRVASLGVAATINPEFAGGDVHVYIGLLWLVPAFLLYLGVIWVLQHLFIEDDEAGPSSAVSRKRNEVTA